MEFTSDEKVREVRALTDAPFKHVLYDEEPVFIGDEARIFERTADFGSVWVVEVQAGSRAYRAVFEPFTGQLIAVSPK